MQVAVALLAALVLAGSVLVVLRSAQSARLHGWVRHTLEVQTELARAGFGAATAESSLRGFALTGERKYLSPGIIAERGLLESLGRIRALTGDNAAQQAKVDALEGWV